MLVFPSPLKRNLDFHRELIKRWVAPELARRFLELQQKARSVEDSEKQQIDFQSPLQGPRSLEEPPSGGKE